MRDFPIAVVALDCRRVFNRTQVLQLRHAPHMTYREESKTTAAERDKPLLYIHAVLASPIPDLEIQSGRIKKEVNVYEEHFAQ